MKSIPNNLRYHLGNVLGYIFYVFSGKKILLQKIDNSKVLSIYFHNPSVYVFESTIKWLLKHNYKIISIKQLKENFKKGQCEVEKNVFISFDDAWSGNINLLPILKKYNLPITLFVPIKALEDGHIWLNTVRRQFANIDNELKNGISIKDLKKISFEHGCNLYDFAKKTDNAHREIMTKEQLIAYSKFASIASHTITHPILTNCSKKIVEFELNQSYKVLNEWKLGTNESFAYPNGSYSEEIIKILKKSQYKYAFTTEPKFIDLSVKDNNYTVPRICIPDNLGKYENLARMSMVWSNFLKK